MFAWIIGNIATILISLVLLAVIAVIIYGMVRDRKKGKLSCGSCCSHCALADKCHAGALEDIVQK